jgi:hypothetical protein
MQSWNLNARHEKARKGPHQLFSRPGLRIDVIELARDEEIGDAWYGDRVLVQVLDGSVRITTGEYTATYDDGTLVALDSGEAQSVCGLEQSRLLLTVTPRPRGHSPGGG